MPDPNTSARILTIARELLASEGLAGLSFDAIAPRLGRSKQAVLYWYPSKQDLLSAMFLPALEAETEAALSALEGVTGRADAITAFVRAVAAFHLADPDRFRLMYLLPQTTKGKRRDLHVPDIIGRIHPVTDRLYAGLADRLGTGPAARTEAMAIHSAVLGLVMMHALAEAVQDPLKHRQVALIDAMAAMLAGQGGAG